MTDTFTDIFGTYPDLPQMEVPPSVCQADRCITLQRQIDVLFAKTHTYRALPTRALNFYDARPSTPDTLPLPRLAGLRPRPDRHRFTGRAGKRDRQYPNSSVNLQCPPCSVCVCVVRCVCALWCVGCA